MKQGFDLYTENYRVAKKKKYRENRPSQLTRKEEESQLESLLCHDATRSVSVKRIVGAEAILLLATIKSSHHSWAGPSSPHNPTPFGHCSLLCIRTVHVRGGVWAEEVSLGQNNLFTVYFMVFCIVCGAKR
ncbi:hypothetical protein CHARACLAT_007959 [Characodon lateralis]|uniref:Uncharacterized protein n=1 Tax=Characodon lateralis TaxID=208331 RepID=A0ABU7F170_9TELE|nr:hypothetical protein [Characodon lateralis]